MSNSDYEYLTNLLARAQAGEKIELGAGEVLERLAALGYKMTQGKVASVSEEAVMKLMRLFWDAEAEERKAQLPGQYWQGKKDGLRIALALLDKKTGIDWAAFQESSRLAQGSEVEVLRAMLKDALRMAHLVAAGEWPDAISANEFLEWYERVKDRISLP